MDFIESSLRHLHDSVGRFIAPSVALRDVRCLKAQIELRRLALRDIEAIRRGLRPFTRRRNERRYRRRQHCRLSRCRLDTGRVCRSL
jgi:hypothetical protein